MPGCFSMVPPCNNVTCCTKSPNGENSSIALCLGSHAFFFSRSRSTNLWFGLLQLYCKNLSCHSSSYYSSRSICRGCPLLVISIHRWIHVSVKNFVFLNIPQLISLLLCSRRLVRHLLHFNGKSFNGMKSFPFGAKTGLSLVRSP